MSIRLGPTTVATAAAVVADAAHITSDGLTHSAVQDSTVKSTHAGISLVTGALNEVDVALNGSAGKKFKPKRAIVTCTAAEAPANLVGGAATPFGVAWTGVADGEFRINVGGGVISVTTCNFGACANMDDIAAVIQARLRVASAGTETVAWVTDHFVITSDDPDPTTSTISLLTAALAGTDISGAGGTDFLNADVGTVHLPPAGAAGRITIGTEGHGGVNILAASGMAGLRGVGQTFEIALAGLFPDIAGNATVHVTSTVGDGTALTYLVSVEVQGTEA